MIKSLSDVLFDRIVETVCNEFAGVEELSDDVSRFGRSCEGSLFRDTDITGEINSGLAS